MFEGKNELFNARNYLEGTQFKGVQYQPSIDFTKDKVFTENVIIKGVKIEKNKLNMAKCFGSLEFTKEINRKLSGAGLKMIYNHIENIWCSKNAELNEYLLNFFACTFGGRKLRKCLYSQTNHHLRLYCLYFYSLLVFFLMKIFRVNSTRFPLLLCLTL